MQVEAQPYLIQRGKIADRFHKEGIDSIVTWDYMGSSEFEWGGALPKSLKSIRNNLASYDYFEVTIDGIADVTIFCSAKKYDQVLEFVQNLGRDKYYLKEFCDFKKWINLTFDKHTSDFWWDIEHNYMWWIANEDFERNFKEHIGG